jgi:drug/metabolite transporter (DMT)-like permease
MDLAALFGLASALCYGTGDYLWQVAGRAVGLWRSSFYGSLIGLLALTAWLILDPGVTVVAVTSAPRAVLAALAAGVALEAGSVLLTQGLIRGSIAVVAPVTAGYGAVTTTLAVANGARFSRSVSSGLALIIAGACIVGIPGRRAPSDSHTRSGIGWAIAAASFFGGGFWLQGAYAVPQLGPVVPVWMMYASGVVLLGVVGLAARSDLSLPERSMLAPLLLASALAVGGFVTLTAGFSTGQVAIVVVLSSLTSAITVLIARIFGAARVALHQWAAITAIVLGLILIRL